MEQFDWTQNPTEVAPTLYQNVITQEERKRRGEYYTPRWLAKEITETVVDAPLNQRVLDPAWGSGTFIFNPFRLQPFSLCARATLAENYAAYEI